MAETKITITKEIMRGADTYLPLLLKTSTAQAIARGSIEKVEFEGGGVPPRYIENPMTKTRCLMGALLTFYLHIKYEGNDDLNMGTDIYDGFASSHIINQIERMKSDALMRDKAFDLLADFRDLEKRVNGEIYNMLSVQNDTVARLNAVFDKALTPEEAQKTMEAIEKLQGEVEKQKAAHDETIEEFRKEDEKKPVRRKTSARTAEKAAEKATEKAAEKNV